MNNILLKTLSLLFLFSSLPTHAMKRAGRSIFSKSSLSLASPRRSTQSRLKSHYFTDTAKNLQAQRYLTTLPQRNHSKSLYYEPRSHKNRSPFNYEDRIGPLIAGVALGTGLGTSFFNQNKIYADEEINQEQETIEKEIIDSSSTLESLELLKSKLNKNPLLINHYREAALKQFDTITSKPHWSPLLKTLFEDAILAQALCNQPSINGSVQKKILFLISKNYSNIFTNTVADYIALNIKKVELEAYSSTFLFERLLASNNENRIKITSSIFSHYNKIEDIFNNNDFCQLFEINTHSEVIAHYATLIAEQFHTLQKEQTENFYWNINRFFLILENKLKFSSKFFIQLSMQNLPLACNIEHCSLALLNVLNPSYIHFNEESENEIQQMYKTFLKESLNLEGTSFGPYLMHRILHKSEPIKKEWCTKTEQAVDILSLASIVLLNHYMPCNPNIKKSIEESSDTESLDEAMKQIIKRTTYQSTCPHECIPHKESNTNPTYVHLSQLSKIFGQKYLKTIKSRNIFPSSRPSSLLDLLDNHDKLKGFRLHDVHLNNMIMNIITKEKELEKDYYTFIHGQKHSYLPCEELHTFLQLTNAQKQNDNYLYLHVKDMNKNSENNRKQKELRTTLLKRGKFWSSDRDCLLFVNWSYFGNSTNLGSSSAWYVAKDINVSSIYLTSEAVFKLNKLENLYSKYKEKLESLHTEFKSITNCGTSIMIAIPKKTINKHIYPAISGGNKRKIAIKGIGTTDDMSIIMETLINEPEKIDDIDEIEFCIPMTYDKKGALNPESGIKVFAFTAADQEKLDDYYARQKALFEEIKKDIEQNKK